MANFKLEPLKDVDPLDEQQSIPKIKNNIVKELILTYKAHPALWQASNKEVYLNRGLKQQGYDACLKVWKKFDEDADLYKVTHKISNLRSTFRKEYRKMHITGKTTLWYFPLMTFLLDEMDNMGLPDAQQKPVISVEPYSDNSSHDISNDDDEDCNPTNIHSPAHKRTKRDEVIFIESTPDLTTDHETESEAFAKFVSKKLSKVTCAEQKMYAETLITRVVNCAILNKLTAHSDILEYQED